MKFLFLKRFDELEQDSVIYHNIIFSFLDRTSNILIPYNI